VAVVETKIHDVQKPGSNQHGSKGFHERLTLEELKWKQQARRLASRSANGLNAQKSNRRTRQQG
jgi:hypothetical protein